MGIFDSALDVYDGVVDGTKRFARKNAYELIGVGAIGVLGVLGSLWTDSVCRDAHEWSMQKGVYESSPWDQLSFDEKVKYSTDGLRSHAATENPHRFEEVKQRADELEAIQEKFNNYMNGESNLTSQERFRLREAGM